MHDTKRSLSIAGVSVLCVGLYFFFPIKSVFQDVIAIVLFLWLIPFLYVRFILKEQQVSFGWCIGRWRVGLMWSVLSFLSALVILLLLMRYTSFLGTIALPQLLQQNFLVFIMYTSLMLIYVAVFESFFRGFVVNGLQSSFGLFSIVLSLILMLFIRDVDIYAASFYLIAPFACLTAYYSRSLYYSFITSAVFMVVATGIIVNALR